MSAKCAVILVVDRLGSGFLGPYGNTWVETPAFNRLASESLLCEFALSDSPALEIVYRSYWTGRHAMSQALERTARQEPRPPRQEPRPPAPFGTPSILLTDEPAVAEHLLAAGFSERVVVPSESVASPADDIEATGIARLLQKGMEIIASQISPFLLWIHSRGMAGPWDAPLEFRNQFADEDDPLPGEFTTPPQVRSDRPFDPDELLRYMHAYAGQVTLLDVCLGALLGALDEHPAASETLFALTSPRGYPLGEHGRVGGVDSALYGELLNVPLMVRLPGKQGALVRTQELIQPHDLFDLLRVHFAGGAEEAGRSWLLDIAHNVEHPLREIACAVADDQRAIRTPAWFLRESRAPDRDNAAESGPHYELFAKPDDRWEVNEVSSRAGEVTELLAASLDAFEEAVQESQLANLPRLTEVLTDVWR